MNLSGITDHLIKTFISFVHAYLTHTGKDIPVSDQYPDKDAEGEGRPRIVVRRGNIRRHETGLSNDLVARQNTMDNRTAIEERLSLLTVSIMIDCLSRVGLEAEALAIDIAEALFVFDEDIRQASEIIHHIGGIEIGAEQKLEIQGGDTEWASVAVTVPISCSWNIEIAHHANTLWTTERAAEST